MYTFSDPASIILIVSGFDSFEDFRNLAWSIWNIWTSFITVNKYHKKFSHIWQQFLSNKSDAGNSLICVKWKSNYAFMNYYLYSTSGSPFLLSLDLKKGSFKTGAYSWFLSILKKKILKHLSNVRKSFWVPLQCFNIP